MSAETIGGTTGSGETARLLAYSSFEPYELAEYRSTLAHTLRSVAIEIERVPTAALTERLLAEADAPKADLVLGWADTAAQTATPARASSPCRRFFNAMTRPRAGHCWRQSAPMFATFSALPPPLPRRPALARRLSASPFSSPRPAKL